MAILTGKVAIVTGGGRGIGRAISLAFAREGADVAIASRTINEIEETAKEIQRLGRRALAVRTDITNQESVEQLMGQVIEEFSGIDILVNNAGIQGPIGPLWENDTDKWIETVQTNIIGTFLCIRALLPIMIEKRQGKIINLSGGGAASPRPYFTAYAASKAAIIRLTETLAHEVQGFNIQVNAIAPGAVNTGMLGEVLEAGNKAGQDELSAAQKRVIDGGVPPERPAALAVFLASHLSGGLTGRLISSIHDDWERIGSNIHSIMSSDIYTLRRVMPS